MKKTKKKKLLLAAAMDLPDSDKRVLISRLRVYLGEKAARQ